MAAREWLERRAGGPARLYDRVVEPLDRAALDGARKSLLGDLGGAVLELGCGTGSAFAHYPAGATVTAIEPEPTFRGVARSRARAAAADVRVLPGDAHDLPYPDGSFDTVVAELMLCSVEAPLRALREAYRVLRSGGGLRLLEHVRHPHPWAGWLQDAVDPLWTRLEGRGCHLGRDTPRAVLEAGFLLDARERLVLPPGPDWLFPVEAVRAHKP